jgi:TnpA family transposase
MAIHSQLIGCSASEVAAMIEGVMRHGTTMDVEASYTDTHGQSEIGFGITRLLGFDLLPRIKRINKTRLYRPAAGDPGAWPRLEPALTRPIRWDLIAAQYDQMIKYATAIRTGTASTEAILRRFTKANAVHPACQAMAETGRAQRTIFLARYLRDRDLQREIGEGLNVVESWNRANAVIFFGKGGDIATNRRDEQELSVLCLRILQAALVYVNTLMVQDVLAYDMWADRLTAEDKRGLTPLFWAHVAPYGEVRLTGGAEVWSMCAIDALGIPAMLGQDVVITSRDPVTGEPVTVTAGPDRTTVWQPGGTVVYIGSRSCSGPAAAVCCDALNFFTRTASARTWAREHPDVTGNIAGQSRAEEIARQTFGALLADD